MKFKLTYFNYSLILFIILTSLTTLATLFSPIIDGRLIFTSLMYCFLTLTLFLALILLVNVDQKKYKKIFLTITTLYFASYVAASVAFITTNQILRKQTFMFIYQIFPKPLVYLTAFILLLLIALLIYFLDKKIVFKKDSKKRVKHLKVNTLISLFILFILIFAIPPIFKIFNPLVEAHEMGDYIYVTAESMNSEKLITEKTGLENPNVIVILLESISAERVGYYGYPRDVTPNIDKLAEEGIVFENAFATCTHSDYAQPGYLSSRYMLTNGIRNFFIEDHERKMVWDVFDERDYFTAYFSSQDDLWAEMNGYFNFDNLDIYSYSLTDGVYDYGSGLGKKDLDHKTMDKTIDWMKEYKEERPFFLYLNMQGTHLPISYPDENKKYLPDNMISLGFMTLTKQSTTDNRYDNAMTYIDAQIGRLMDELQRENKLENTVILLSSDHGHDFLKRHNIDGHGNSVYNDELQVPLIMYIPDIKGKIISTPVSHIDVIPTFIDLLGIERQEEFMGKPMAKENRFFFYAQNHKHFIGMYKDELKIIVDLNKKTAEVYNITEDFNEENNLINKGHYDEQILELLMWHNCQTNYFSKINPPTEMAKYCEGYLDK